MPLSFLGKSYPASFPAIAATATNETATFLGQPYAGKQFHLSQRQQSSSELTYRGIRYTR